jgi:hypothetical protein
VEQFEQAPVQKIDLDLDGLLVKVYGLLIMNRNYDVLLASMQRITIERLGGLLAMMSQILQLIESVCALLVIQSSTI